MTLTRRDVTELLERHGLSPSRALGQNFVADPNTVRRIVRLAGVGPGEPVVEIGPGVGSLTTALAEAGAEVVAVELDRHLVPVLEEVVGPLGVKVVQGDALEVAWADLLAAHERWSLVANLPYNVGTTIVLQLLDPRVLLHPSRLVGAEQRAPGGPARQPQRSAYGVRRGPPGTRRRGRRRGSSRRS